MDRRTSTESRFVWFASGGTSETGDQLDFHNTYDWDKLNRVDVVTQESANDPLAATWMAKAITTRTVDLSYFADSSLQSITRTQGRPFLVRVFHRNAATAHTMNQLSIMRSVFSSLEQACLCRPSVD